MPEPGTLATGCMSVTKGVLSLLLQKLTDKRKLKIATSEAFRSAFTETEIYCAALSRNANRDFTQEANLGRLWSTASSVAAPYDSEVSNFCKSMSGYWINPPEDPVQRSIELLTIVSNFFDAGRIAGKVFK